MEDNDHVECRQAGHEGVYTEDGSRGYSRDGVAGDARRNLRLVVAVTLLIETQRVSCSDIRMATRTSNQKTAEKTSAAICT